MDGSVDVNTDGTIDIATTAASAATFANGDKTADAVSLGGIDISSQSSADTAITKINDAIQTVSAERSKLGAYQNRLDHSINNLNTSSENLTAAESRIRDVDMAKEMMNQTKQSILAQASQAMLAKANQNPQGVLQLLR
uniref:flagellin n=1 Tax=Halobacillus salinarum TaxID=2932257 RepID=UPI0037BF84E8